MVCFEIENYNEKLKLLIMFLMLVSNNIFEFIVLFYNLYDLIYKKVYICICFFGEILKLYKIVYILLMFDI